MTTKQKRSTKGTSPSDMEAGLTEAERRERDAVVPYLMNHAYHLPGNNWWQDWWQYMTNNHPVFSLCLHHRFHPLSWKIRLVSLIGSMLFGLALTSVVYCLFVFMGQDSKKELLRYQTGAQTGVDPYLDSYVSSVSVTTGNLVLFFVGSPIHGLYDSLAWLLAGCSCITFEPKDGKLARVCRTSGAFILSFTVIVIAAVASFSVMLQSALEADQDIIITSFMDNNTNATSIYSNGTSGTTLSSSGSPNILESPTRVDAEFHSLVHEQNFQGYQFIISYAVELILSYLVFYPLAGTIFFSGILASCCCKKSNQSPLLGGRPYEVNQESQEPIEQGVEVEWNAPPPKASVAKKNPSTKQGPKSKAGATKKKQTSTK